MSFIRILLTMVTIQTLIRSDINLIKVLAIVTYGFAILALILFRVVTGLHWLAFITVIVVLHLGFTRVIDSVS